MFNKILVAIDTSDMSKHVFDEAVSLAKINNANLMLLHVLNPLDEQYIDPVFVQPTILYPEYKIRNDDKSIKNWEQLKEERLEWLRYHSEQAKKLGIAGEYERYTGEASRTICDVARNWGADIIVMGRRGRRGLSELFLGSVSNYVIHHAPCSVLVVQGSANVIDEEVSQTKKLESENTT